MFKQSFRAIAAHPSQSVFLAIVAMGLLLRVLFFQGLVESDPYFYADIANKLAHGNIVFSDYNGAVIFPIRIAFYGPVALFVGALGLSEFSLTAFPMIISIGGFFVAYILGKKLFGTVAGLIAALLVAVIPIDIAMASTLFPDPAAAFWANLGIALLILNPDRENTRRSLGYAAFAGACFGVSWLNKETVIYLGPFVLFLLLQRKAPLPQVIVVAATSFLFLVCEAIFYKITTGDLLFHFNMMSENYKQNSVWFFNQDSPYFGWEAGGYRRALLHRLFISGPRGELFAFSMLPVFALLAAAWGAWRRDGRFIMLGVWLVSQMVFFNFGTSSLTSYLPLPLEFFERYLYPLLLPSVLLCAGFVALLYQGGGVPEPGRKRRLGAMLLGAAILGSITLSFKDLRPRPLQPIRHVAQTLSPSDVVYTDYYTAAFLAFFAQNKILNANELEDAKPITPYENVSAEDMIPGSYVVINDFNVDFTVKRSGTTKYQAPEFYKERPSSWKLISKEKGVSLFRIEGANSENMHVPPEGPR